MMQQQQQQQLRGQYPDSASALSCVPIPTHPSSSPPRHPPSYFTSSPCRPSTARRSLLSIVDPARASHVLPPACDDEEWGTAQLLQTPVIPVVLAARGGAAAAGAGGSASAACTLWQPVSDVS